MSPPKKGSNITALGPGERGGGVTGATGKADGLSAADGPKLGGGANSENNLFNKHYNKELKLCEGKEFKYSKFIIKLLIHFIHYFR